MSDKFTIFYKLAVGRNHIVQIVRGMMVKHPGSGNQHVIPPRGRRHDAQRDCWCGPSVIDDFWAGGVIVVHNEVVD